MKLKITLFAVWAVLCCMPTAFGQCVTGGLYPDTAFTPACSGTQEIVNTDCWAGEYAQINVTANNQYVFASSTATDFITVTDGAGSTIYAFGTSPVSWNSNSVSGVIRYYIHKTSGCVAENIGRIRYITCTPGGCGQPSGLNVTNITSNSARLNWSAPGTAPSVGYDYYVSTSNVTPIATTVPTGTVASTLNSLTALTASTTYFYWVRSNCNATKSAWVSGGSFTTIAFQACNGASYGLYPETTFTPAYTGSFEEITADAWAGEYSNINILANKQYTFTSSVGTDYVTVTNATGTVVYATGTSPVIWNSGNVTGVIRYYLHANSSCGDNSVSRQKGIVATDTCNQPATLASSNVTSSSATLTWSTPSVPSGGYDYYISTSSTAPNAATTPSGNLNANNITFNGTLAASTTYYWWVRSNCGATKSAWSGPITFTTLAVPVGCTTGTLWPSTTYTPQCTGAQELIVNNAYGGEYTNISVPNNYKRLTFASSVSTDFITITNATGTQVLAYGTTPVVYNVENAPVTLRYYIHTNSACGTQNINRNRYITCDNTVCVSPISLTSSNVTSSGALLSWNFSTSQAANYEFYVSTSSAVAPQYTTAPTGSSPTLAAPIGNLNPSTTYYFWVRSACNNTDKSNWVYGGSFTTLANTVCGDPTNVSIINVTSNSAFVSLTAPSPFPTSGYQYYFAGTNVAPNSATTPTGTFPAVGQANITGLNPSQTYYAWIRSACGGSSVGNWVSAGSFTTVAAASCNGTTGVFGVYPPGTFTIPNCDGSAQVISTASWAGEYANVNITAGKYYTFTSSVATDYLTITNATGSAVFASGQTPVVWYSGTTTGTIRYFMHTNANCGAEQVNRTRSVSCEAPVVGLVGTAALGWGTDVFMSSVDGVNFTLNNYTLTTGEVKFRLNGAWNLNWGGATFPTGTGIQDGQNIPVVGCTYNITFNLNTKAYTFTTTSTSPSAPTGTANQIVCNNPTLASFTVTGTNIKWYSAAIGGNLLAANTPVTTGTTYYASQSNGTCESPTRLAVTAIATPLPTASATQTFCTGATVANLQATGTALKWYNVPANGTALTGATVLAAGTYYVSQTLSGCESGRRAVTVTLTPKVTPTFTQVAAICSGATLSALPTTSNNGITGTWSPALNNTTTTTYTFTPGANQCANTTTMTITVNPIVTPTFTQVAAICSGATLSALPTTSNNGITGTWSPALNNTTTTTYTFTPSAGQCATTRTMTITVNPKVTPTFTQVAAICSGATLSALPTTSNNGITGTWSPALNNTATTTYTFTPGANQCANTTTMTITVNPIVTPTFTQVAAICSGATLSALPTTSNNGITGTWSPALNNAATTTYTFTPSAGQCATTRTMTITVNPKVTPTFTQVAAICSGATLSALPTTSNNGITGTWSPALNNTATTTYTFTPAANQCANTTTMTITVNPIVTPTFTQVAAICSGATLSALPTTSNNGITGTWSPALNNTATTTYTFTPSANQCANTTTMTITVNPVVTPTFTQVAAICSGATLSALPTTSNNGITGTWSPALNNTATTTYTFTPAANQCANTTTMTITVNPIVTPTFTQVAAICSGATLSALPTTSNNGITGTWSPALNNTATTTYTFTPSANQCANTTTMTITVNPIVTPTFTQVTAICSGATLSALPTTSNNGITGTWSPALNNTATTTYTFTPAANQCANTTTMTITVNPIVTPTFTQVAAICSGATLSALPTTSNNGITGTWSPALNNTATTTYTFTPSANQCANTTTMTITVNPIVTPTFTQVTAICSGATLSALPTTSNNGITGTWSPALNNTATTTYTFTPAANQCANTTTMTITVNPIVTPTFTQVAAICSGASLSALPTTSNNGITGTWSPALNNTATTTYTFTPSANQCANTTTMTITVNPIVTPTFTQVAAICSGATLSALPTTSNNGITGTWSPALNNTATTTYTFTPGANQCANTTTMTITVNPIVTPTFTQVAAICSGATLSALPTTSNNGITGTWSPALNNTATTTYTFTPAANQCANTTTMTITVNPILTPTFTQVAAICSGATLSALPTTSNNGITGTWSPALNNTATTTYTFTPAANQCANTTTMTITVNPVVTPTFTQVAAICSGATLSALPTTSNNGITGTWSPALNNTATTTYTFTPAANQCANTTTMTITVNPILTPTFTQVAAICSGATLSALPTTSNNGITGTWSPALNNTATTTYTFTPDASQCADTATMTITVNPIVTPTFTQVAAICSGATLSALPTTSNNGITGIWSPTLDNTATTTYTFTPDAGQCAETTAMTITVNPIVTPTFTQVAAICSGATLSALPTTSNNGITGTWSPALDNAATTTYTFTPDAGQCAETTAMTITVNPIVTPTFTQVAAICSGATLSALPTTSNNGITGTWSPALDNTATTTYTFTPDAGQCADTATMTITVNPVVTPAFTQVEAICSGATLVLPSTSENGITGTWSPALDTTATTTYTFTPDAGQCADTTTMTITVTPNETPVFTPVAAICSGDTLLALPMASDNGITGTWSPALDNTVTTTYTFTPDAGQCATTATMTITVHPVPVMSTMTDITACVSYTLPELANGNYYTAADGQGTMLVAGDAITSTQTIYVFADNGNCTAQTSFVVTITETAVIDELADVTVCGSYTLPVLTSNANYYTAPGGAGTMLQAGDVITTSQTVYLYVEGAIATCTAESDVVITVNPVPTVESFEDVTVCDSYVLPSLANGNYFTASNGAGVMLNAGDVITASQTIYVYATNGDCTAESDFDVIITPTPPVEDRVNVTVCDAYMLPALTTGDYFTESNGQGEMLMEGDIITSTQTIYLYATNGDCDAETSFTVTVVPAPTVESFEDVTACGSYILPALAGGNYYTEANAGGTLLLAGDSINQTQTVYIYANNSVCSTESSFTVTITTVDNTVAVNEATLTANQSGATYQWVSCDDLPSVIQGETGQSFTATSNGQYAVIVTLDGCTIMSDCVTVDSLSIDQPGTTNIIALYPNPTNGAVTVDTGHRMPDTIVVIDNLGRLISQFKPTALKSTLQMDGHEDGVYYIKIQFGQEEITKKLILRKN